MVSLELHSPNLSTLTGLQLALGITQARRSLLPVWAEPLNTLGYYPLRCQPELGTN